MNLFTRSDAGVAVGAAQVVCVFEPAWFPHKARARARTREWEKVAEAVALLERALELSIEHTQLASTTEATSQNAPARGSGPCRVGEHVGKRRGAHSHAVTGDPIGIVRAIS
jgi:hypothetical protein